MKRVVIALVVLLIIAHQDYWAWDRIDPLVFGIFPIGLAWHIGISIAAAIVWALAVRYCWPTDVDVPDTEDVPASKEARG